MNHIIKVRKTLINTPFKVILVLFLILSLPGILLRAYYINRIYPGILVAGIDVSHQKISEGTDTLNKNVNPPKIIELTDENNRFELDIEEIELTYDFEGTSKSAFNIYRESGFITNLFSIYRSLFKTQNINLTYSINEKKLNEFIKVLSTKIDVNPKSPLVSFNDGKILIDKGSEGKSIEQDLLSRKINDKLSKADFSKTGIPTKKEGGIISEIEAASLENRAKKLLGKNLIISDGDKNIYTVDDYEILSFLDIQKIKTKNIFDFIISKIDPLISTNPQNAVFKSESGRVIEFKPAKDGNILNINALAADIEASLFQIESGGVNSADVQIQKDKVAASITTEEVNNLGIKELLGTGTSKFAGSIPGRIHNVNLASSRLNGVLIPPGMVTSFNNILGDVSAFTGYKQAYIIKDGKTILGDGGGVCQTSTTLFRAVLSSGLPIVERRAHAYRVGYYEQDSPPGLDATVFSPSTDFKFKNDTPGYLLIQTFVDLKNLKLTYEIYGTKDGRVATTTKPIIASQIAPPEDLYVDDPNLPNGKIQQIEHKAWGAKVTFSYKVEKDSQTIFEKTFVSNYRPWQAIYLRGTKTI